MKIPGVWKMAVPAVGLCVLSLSQPRTVEAQGKVMWCQATCIVASGMIATGGTLSKEAALFLDGCLLGCELAPT